MKWCGPGGLHRLCRVGAAAHGAGAVGALERGGGVVIQTSGWRPRAAAGSQYGYQGDAGQPACRCAGHGETPCV